MNAIFRLSERAVVDIRVDNVKRPWRLDLEDGDPCYLPLPLPEQTVAMTVRQQAAKAMADAVYLTDPSDFEVTVGDSRFVFKAHVTDVFWDSARGTMDCKLRPVGRVFITTLKEKVMATCISRRGVEIPKGRKEILSRRYYIGSKNIFPGGTTPDWANGTLAEAEAKAQKQVEDTGEDQFIVKIVRIVRKRPTPVDIEKV